MHRQQRQAREGLGLRALRRAVWSDDGETGEAPQALACNWHAPGSHAAEANAAWQEFGRSAARGGWARRFILDVAHGRLSLPPESAAPSLSEWAQSEPDCVLGLIKQAHPICAPVAAAALGRAGSFHGELVALAQDADMKLRLAALAGLAEEASHGCEDAVEELAKRAGDPAGEVRSAAIAALGRARGKRAVLRASDRLARLVGDADERALGGAALAAAALCQVSRRQAVALLQQIAARGTAGKRAVAAAVGGLPRSAAARIADSLAKDPDENIRSLVAVACGRWAAAGNAPARTTLTRMVGDSSPTVRGACAGAAAMTPECWPQFAETLAGDPSPSVRAAVAEAAAAHHDTRTAAVLLALVSDKVPAVRACALRRLASLGMLAPVREIIAGSSDPGLVAVTAEVLDPTDPRDAQELLGLTHHRSSDVASAAARNLARNLLSLDDKAARQVVELASDERTAAAVAQGLASAVDADVRKALPICLSLFDKITPDFLWMMARSATTSDLADLARSAARASTAGDDMTGGLRDLGVALRGIGLKDAACACLWLAECAEAETLDAISAIRSSPKTGFDPTAYLATAARLVKAVVRSRSGATRDVSSARAMAALDMAGEQHSGEPYGRVLSDIAARWRGLIESHVNAYANDRAEIQVSLTSQSVVAGPHATISVRLKNPSSAPARKLSLQVADAPEAYQVPSLPAGAEATVLVRVRITDPGPHAVRGTLRFHGSQGRRTAAFSGEVTAVQPAASSVTRNPFVLGKPLAADSPMFFGRAAEMEFVERALASGDSGNVVVLTGQRRIGKTSLLRRLEARLAASYRYHPVFVDVQGILVADTNAFFRELSRHCMPAGAEVALSRGSGADFVRETADRLDGRLVLLLDEFDDLDQKVRSGRIDAEVFSQFRNLIQHSPNVNIVLCGTHRLEDLAAEHWSFLLNLATHKRIGLLDRGEVADAMRVTLAGLGITCDGASVDRLVALTGRHPYLLQLLGYRLLELCVESGDSAVKVCRVDRAADEVIEQGDIHLSYFWDAAGTDGQLVLRALAGTEVGMTSDGLRHATGIEQRQLGRTLRDLTTAEIVTENAGRHSIGIGLLSRWIANRGLR